MTSPQSRQDLAESLFAAWLTRREAGANEPLEEFVVLARFVDEAPTTKAGRTSR